MRDVPALMAIEELETQGYRIEHRPIASPTLITDLLARGELEIGVTNHQTVWAAIAKGADIRTVAQFTAPTTVLATQRAIASCADLDGRSMGVSSPTGLSQLLIRDYLDRRCGGAQPQLIVMAESASRAIGLQAGRLDAAVMPGDEIIKLELREPGRFRVLMTHHQEFPAMLIDGFHFNRAWARAHPGAVTDFLRAMLQTYRRIAVDRQLLYDEAQKRLGVDARTAKALADSHFAMRIWDPNGGLTTEKVAYILEFLVKVQTLPARLRVSDVADLSYLEAVLEEIGREDAGS
jgi:ABC-type nitrate/sulfonate/bicarbonate transport system substrate-binding protein